ncbi:MmgE/PrpD family protein [Solirubrobacter ginsenosidimutans]|uniref:MmgE/PrpD family protein n=1 Tax=Solirubrobacter ginsenosidimutans TaxID=490573 RepID=A0A9X3MP26_9ACTN|nr:MmgE/PrpD family protein [Solirubrobacter ginsenosidimutans]MDA0159232.1 MmgE/PrpD family protein [Solirubrobacter ginsenosidimutans]
MESNSITATLSTFAAELRFEDLPGAVVDHVERLVLDTLGCALGGTTTPLGALSQRFAALSGEAPQASVAGSAARTGASQAAAANGRMAGALDADDTFTAAGQTSHHGAPTVAAALALAERDGLSGAELLTAVAAGYEIGARIGAAIPAHATTPSANGGWKVGGGPAGVLAPALASARALGLDAGSTAHAFGIAGAHVELPPLKWFEGRVAPMVKSMDCGWNAASGLNAAQLAGLGMTGHGDILDGPHGLWRALGHDHFDGDVAVAGLGERWWTLGAKIKAWPCQYWMQPSLLAFAEILIEHGLAAEELERVLLRTSSRSGAPRFRDQHPEGFVTASFNFPHAAAMLALGVPAGPRWAGEDALADPRASAVRERVEVETTTAQAVIEDGMLVALAGSAVVWARGERFEASADAPPPADLASKLAAMVEPLGPAWAGRDAALLALAGTLRDAPDVRGAAALLRPTG